MKISFSLLLLLIASLLIYSCNTDSVIGPAVNESFQWELRDSLIGESVFNAAMVDEDNVYLAATQKGIRINYGVKTTIDFQDVNFSPTAVDAFSASYYAYAGTNFTGKSATALKIFSNGVLSTVIINPDSSLIVGAIKIIQPGKILISVERTFYVYENNILTAYRLGVDGYGYYISVSGSRTYLAVTDNSGYQSVYKFENNSLTQVENVYTGEVKLKTDDAILKAYRTDKTYIGYYDAAGLKPLLSDDVNHSYFFSTGQNLNLIYFVGFDTADSNKAIGMIWNGIKLYKDKNFPVKRDGFGYSFGISNMRSSAFFFCRNIGDNSYIYKARYLVTPQSEE